MSTQQDIYLASTSPRRQELLRQIGIGFTLLPVEVDETVQPCEIARHYVKRLAEAKAVAAWDNPRREQALPVLAADTAVVVDDSILGKPRDTEHARQMLRQLSGRQHEVLTAVSVRLADRHWGCVQASQVHFTNLDDATIAAYCATGEPLDKAGAYAIQGLAARFISRIEGSYSGVMGLPLFETAQLLRRAGVKGI